MIQQKEQMHEEFAQRMGFVSALHDAGVNGEELLSQLYCRFLPDAEDQLGDRMARYVLEQIAQFEDARNQLQNWKDPSEEETQALLGEQILNRMEGFTVTSQCRKLHSLKQGLSVLDELNRGTSTLEEAVRLYPAGYRGNTGGKGRNEALRRVLETLCTPWRRTADQRKSSHILCTLRQHWMDETLYRGILILSLYTMLVSGERASAFEELPVSIEFITVAVCSLLSDGEREKQTGEPEWREGIDDLAVKLFLVDAFLAGGTATVMFVGSSVMVCSAYYWTARTVEQILLGHPVS